MICEVRSIERVACRGHFRSRSSSREMGAEGILSRFRRVRRWGGDRARGGLGVRVGVVEAVAAAVCSIGCVRLLVEVGRMGAKVGTTKAEDDDDDMHSVAWMDGDD